MERSWGEKYLGQSTCWKVIKAGCFKSKIDEIDDIELRQYVHFFYI